MSAGRNPRIATCNPWIARCNPRIVMRRALTATVGWLRAVSGDDAYERYLTHHARVHAGPPLSRKAFYEEREQRKWSGVSRCC